jgi:uncharacterized repeat protein (TIGR01451 family)
MSKSTFHTAVGWLIGLGLGSLAHAQALPDAIAVRAIAEVEVRTTEQGREVTKLAPADRLVSGDAVMYTLEVRNTAATTARAPTVTYPVPPHLSYLPESAVGPGTGISFSVDGGRSFDAADNLKIKDSDGQLRPAGASDYTHIRWQLKNALKPNSVAFVRFCARVK